MNPKRLVRASLAIVVSCLFVEAASAQLGVWTNLGHGHPGTLGTPSLEATPAQYGRMLNLHADDVAAWSLSVCVIGTVRIDVPVFGGLVVPEPIILLNGLPQPSARHNYRLLLPDVCLAGSVDLYAQVLVLDGGASQGWAFSNAIEASVRDNIPSDFNGDGYSDLAVGVPGEDVQGVLAAGAVNVVYGTSSGLDAANDELLRPGKFVNGTLAGAPGYSFQYGSALATGDFNGDGYDDLAVGAERADIVVSGTTYAEAGSVHVIYGSAVGLQGGSAGPNDRLFTQGGSLSETVESDDRFGKAVAAGDFDGDGYDDLAIGVPNEGIVHSKQGIVHLLRGGPLGVTSGVIFTDPAGAGHVDLMGASVLFADLDGDGLDDLVVGKEGEQSMSGSYAGAVAVIREDIHGALSSIEIHRDQSFNGQPVAGDAISGDSFGASLAAADFSRDGAKDLVVGVPLDDIAGQDWAGSVHLFRFVPGAAVPFADSIWHQGTSGVIGTAQTAEYFGRALTIYDRDLDGLPDLAIGVPGEQLLGAVVAGGVNVLRGSTTTGLTATNDALLTYPGLGLGAASAYDSFGRALCAGRYDGTCNDRLAIGVPGATVNGVNGAGAVVITGGGQLTDQWSQGPLNGLVNAFDGFGAGLSGGSGL